MDRLKRLFSTSVLLASLGLASIANAEALGLRDIYQLALEQDRQWQAAQYQQQASAEVLGINQAALKPQVSLSANASYTDASQASTGGQQNASISLSQALFNPAAKAQAQAAGALKAQSEYTLALAQQQLIIDTAERYFSILRASDNLRYTQAERKAIEQQLQQARSRYEVGLSSVTDVKEAQASRDQAFSSEIAAQNTLEIARENLRVSIAQLPEKLATLGEKMPLKGPEKPIEDYLAQALEKQLELKNQQANQRSAEYDLSAARAARLPTLTAIGSLDARRAEGPQADTDSATLGLNLNWPLYTGGQRSAVIRQAKARLEQQTALSEQQQRRTEQAVRQAYLNQVSAVNQVKALKEALQSTQVAYEATEAGYNVGTNTAVEVLLALRETYRGQANYASARYDYLLSQLQLSQAVGTLTEASLAEIDRWLIKP